MARKGSFEFEIKAVTNSEELDKFSNQLNSFYKKYENKEMKVKTPDFREAIKSVQSLEKAYEDYKKKSETSSAYTGLADKIKADLDEARSYFRETKAVLENGDIVSGLDAILGAASRNIHATVVDIGGYVDSLYEKINDFQERLYDLRGARESVYDSLNFSADTTNFGGILNTNELYEQKQIIDSMLPVMREINNFHPGTYSDYDIDQFKALSENSSYAIEQMQRYNLETTEQLALRQELIRITQQEGYGESKVSRIKGDIASDKEAYDQAIQDLNEYISEKERAIETIRNYELELFSTDGISQYIENAQQGIKRYKSIISDLTDYYDKMWGNGNGGGDTTQIVKSLNELKETISSIKSSLEPISDIFKNEGNAIQSMAENGTSSFNTLSEAVNALYNNLLKVEQAVDSISKKDFNITNITQSNDTIKAVDLTKQYRDAARLLYDQIYNGLLQDVVGQYGNMNGISGQLRNDFSSYIRDLMGFDSKFNKKDLNASSLSKAQEVFERLQQYKQGLLEFINSVNKVIPDTFTKQYKDILDPKAVQDSKLNEVAKTIDKSTESVDNSKLATTSEYLQKISEALLRIQDALIPLTKAFSSEDSFFNKMASGDTSFIDKLIEKLNEASRLMNSVARDSGNANDSSKLIQQEASAMDEVQKKADDAASSKEKFATANKKVKQSAEDTVAGVLAEAAAMEEAGESAQKVWTTPRNGTSLKALNLPTEIVGENGQSITQMFAAVKKQLEDEFHSPVQIEFTSKPNEDGQLEATRATITYINEASGITVKQFYDIARSEEGIVVATQAAERATIGATKAASGFNAEMQKALALERIETFRKQCGSISIDLTKATNAANAIVDKDSWNVFNAELQIAQEKLKQIRSELKGENTLDTIAAAEKKLLTLPTRIDTLRKKLQPLMKLEGADEISKKLDSIMKSYETFMTSNDSDVKIQEFKNIINVLTEVKAEMDNIKQDKSVSAYDDTLNKQVASYKKIIELRNKLNSGNLGDEESKSILERLKAEQKNYIELDKQLKTYTNLYNAEEKLKALAEARKSVLKKIAEEEAKAQAKEEKKANRQASNYGKSVTNSATKKYKNIMWSYEDISDTFTISDKFQSAIDDYITKYNQLLELRQKFENNPNLAKDDAETKKFDALAFAVEKARKEVKSYIDEASRLQNVKEKGTQIGVEKQFDPSKISSSTAALKEYIQSIAEGKVQITGWNADGTEMYGIIDKGKGIVEQFTAVMDGSINTMYAYRNSAKDTGTAFQQFLNGVRGKAKEIATYLIGGNAVYKTISEIRKGITYVKEIDSALTELKKVTDETDATYAQFLKTMSQTGAEVGATVKDLTNMSANWARLGYNIQEAGELAKSTAVLLNVSEFKSADEASEALISTMQAYGYAAEDSMHVVDVLNEIGNNFAISSDGIATALQDSASSLMAAGNNLEQSVAMIAAANKVLQDPNSVGAALRTISLRIRGTSIKILEEMGEETDGVIESVSKLQAKVKGLSGVDILTDTGSYKDTYTVIKEIAQVWDQMNDMNRAALLELLAGKNRSNAMAALLGNLDDLEGAYESAMEAQGSAEAENEKYMNSIQGKIDQFNNAVQTMWKNAISSDAVKFFVDVAKGIVTIIDKIGLLETAIGGLIVYFKYIKPAIGNKSIWKKVIGEDGSEYFEKVKIKAKESFDATSKASQEAAQKVAQSQQKAAESAINASAQETAAKKTSTAATVEHTAANEADKASTTEAAAAEQTRAATSQQEAADQTAATSATLKNVAANEEDTKSTLEAAAAEKIRAGTSQAEADAQAGSTSASGSNVVSGLIGGTVTSGATSGAASGIFSGLGKKAAALIPVIGKAIGVMIAVNLAFKVFNKIVGNINDLFHRAENLKKEVTALESEFKKSQKESNETLKKLTTSSDNTKYETLLDEFKELTKGVDQYGNNISLTTEQYKRYEEICETICEINPSLASGYNTVTESIGKNASALEKLIELEKVHAREAAREYVSDDNLEKIAENAQTEYENVNKEYEKILDNPTVNGEQLSKKILEAITFNGEHFSIPNAINSDEYAAILRTLGVDFSFGEKVTGIIDSIFKGGMSSDDFEKTIVDHFDEIKDAVENAYNNGTGLDFNTIAGGMTGLIPGTYSIDKDQVAILYDTFISQYNDWQQEIDSKKVELESKKKALVDTLLQVPSSMPEYDKLSANSQRFITKWIKDSKMFEIDDDFKAEDVLGMKTSIQSFIRDLANNVYQYTVKASDNIKGLKAGDKIDASTILDQIVDINPSKVDYSQYKEQVQKLIDMLWESLGTSGQAKFNNDKGTFAVSLGFDFTTKDEDVKKNSELIAKRLGTDAEDIQKKVEEMPASQVDAFVKINWNEVETNSWEDVVNAVQKEAKNINVPSVDTYSTLADGVSKFNEVLTQTSEIAADNTNVTQEYKDSITALGFSQEELNDVFDESNPLLVKNAALLRKLVLQKREEKRATVQAAKAQTQLQYRNTVKQLQQVVEAMGKDYKATGLVTDATKKSVDVLRSQLTALRQAQREYALLEIQLSGATSAYENFEKAKSMDEKLTYGDSMIEMLNTINAGFKTGQVGTEAFRVAVETLVPSSVYDDLDNFNDRMVAIHDYIDKNPLFADWFTIKDGEFSITQKNIQAFVEDAQKAGAFTQSDENGNFFLPEDVDSIDKFVDKINEGAEGAGVTKEAVVVMLTEFAKYDASWSDILSDLTTNKFDKKINDQTKALEEATLAKVEYLKAGGEYDKDGNWVAYNTDRWNELCNAEEEASKALDNARAAAAKNSSQYSQLEAIYKSTTGELKLTQEQADALAKALGLVDANGNAIKLNVDDNGTIQLTTEQAELLNQKRKELTEPTIVTVQANFDNLSKQLDTAKKYLSGENLSEEEKTVLFDAGINVDKITPEQLQAKIDALPEDQKQVLLDAGLNLDGLSKEEIQAKIDEMPEDQKKVLLDAGIKVDAMSAEELKTACNNLITTVEPQLKSISLTYGITKTSEEQQDGTIEKLKDWEVNGIHFTAYAKMDEESKNKVSEEKKDLGEDENPTIYPTVDPTSYTIAETKLDNLEKDRTSTVYVNTVETGSNSTNTSSGGYSTTRRGRFNGTANASGNWGLEKSEHNSLVGELGTETVVDPHTGRYYTVGDHGAELVDLPKDAIIFNHLQTKELFKNGHINSRGKLTGGAYAEGNAHYGLFDGYTNYGEVFKNGSDNWVGAWDDTLRDLSDSADSLSGAADDISGAADKFEETFDWFAILLEEIENSINLMNAQLENAVGINSKKNIYYQILDTEYFKVKELNEGIKLYTDYSAKLLAKVPDKYKEMAKNGAVAITDFLGEANQEVVEAINNYREWENKVTDLNQQLEETKKNISDTHVEIQNMVKDEYDNRISLITAVNDRIQETIDLLDEEGKRSSAVMYEEMIKNSTKQLSELQNKRAEMQQALDKAVSSGDVEKGKSQWYEMVNAISDVDSEINDCKVALEGFQNSINQLHWDNFEKFIDAIDNVGTEISNLGDLIDEEDVVDEIGNWTKKGITALGLYAQEMERAKYRAEQYGKEIEYLNQEYAAGKYSVDEYNEKLQELKDGQWDSIKSYEAAKKSIIDLNKTRVEAIKDGIQKEIDAYSELIDKKKEELSLQKDAHDFSKQVAEQQKNVADLQKKLAVMAGDNSASAIAQKKKLQAELSAAQQELEELYYNHSVEKQQEALDKSLENYQDNKQNEMDALDESLKNEEQVISDSYAIIAANTESVAQTLAEIASQYGITLSDSVTKPWLDGANAIGTYQEQLDTSMSSFTQQLEALKKMYADLQAQADSTGRSMVDAINSNKSKTESSTYTPPQSTQPSTPSQPSKPSAPSAGASVTVKKSATNFSRDGGNGTRMQSWVPGSTFTVYKVSGSEVLIGRNGGYTGWVRLSDIEGYAKGTKGVTNDQLAMLDELGEELVLHAGKDGKLQFLTKGTSVIPSDITENLMKLGSLDPRQVLDNNRPSICAPHIINNNMEINMEIAEVVHIDHADNSSIPDITKAVQKQMDAYMKNINQGLKRYTR